ncbi:hypothetical protein [Pelagicoccus sp. SDUM812002]|uniref:hypothetical protein n=1 Tax=Pelagicoccus sp. SDUM812002 TaxID=3041266 RepID=UPI00280C84D3|nr:hypothetical protein [Pelagicoccus sp. SDUM812002]MDQ8185355.1 hypothetical protein [Pelagicoccus sp. SDUM812002]
MKPNIVNRLSKIAGLLAAVCMVASADACSVCAVGKEEARAAYYATTAILSFLPLIMIGGVVYYLFKRNR